MKPAGHLRLLALATGAWLAFWVLGLPDYYRQYPAIGMLAFDLALLPLIWLWVRFALKRSRRRSKTSLAAWLAFYFTVPFLVYDWAYCGLYLGAGPRFLVTYWYLTVYYVVPWLVFVPVGLRLDRRDTRAPAAQSC